MSAFENKMSTFKSEKLAFYKWIHKWVSTNNISIEGGPVDTPQIAAVLQAMGYKLETIEHVSSNEEATDTMKIEVKCNKSGMQAILSKQMDTCICPSLENASEGHFWTVSGTGPSCSQDNLNRVDETYSTLIPTLSKEKSMLVRDILTKLFAIISDTDVNRNDEYTAHNSTWSTGRSLSDLTRPAFIRQNTWEEDLKNTPPTSSSSPLPEKLTKSMSQMSLNSDKEQMLAEILLIVKDNLDKALVLLPNKNDSTFTKPNKKRIPDLKFSPPKTMTSVTSKTSSDLLLNNTPIKLQQDKENTPRKLQQDKENTPRKLQQDKVNTPKSSTVTSKVTSNLTLNKTPMKLQFQQDKDNTVKSIRKSTEKCQFVVPSKFGTFTKKTKTPNKNPVPFVKKDTPIPIVKNLTLPLSSDIPDRRLSLGTYSRNTSIRANLNLSGCSPVRRTGIPSFGFKSPATVSKTGIVSPFTKPK